MIKHAIAKFFSYLYFPQIGEAFRGFGRMIKSEYLSRHMKSAGKNSRFFAPTIVKGGKYIEIGDNFSADRGFVFQCWDSYAGEQYNPSIVVGNNAHIGMDSHIAAINRIVIGDNLLTGKNCYISDHSHVPTTDLGIAPIDRPLYSKGPVVIGNNVWLGDNVSILPNVTIGDNVIIGANSVVTRSVESNTVVAGAPARVIKTVESYVNKV